MNSKRNPETRQGRELSLSNQALIAATERGYYVDPAGVVWKPNGEKQKCYKLTYRRADGSILQYYRFCVSNVGGRPHIPILVHRLAGFQKFGEAVFELEVDHHDQEGLNNRRGNLRLATSSQNGRNRKATGKSRFLGVSWDPRRSKWRVSIKLNGKDKWLGYFKKEEAAARSYDAAALEIDPEFASLNFPDEKGGAK